MQYRYMGRTGLKVSALCLGCMTFGNEADEETSKQIVNAFIAAGGNFFDTANVYSRGVSEEILGRALFGRRHEVAVATKFRFAMGDGPNDLGASRFHIVRSVEDSLRRLQTDYIDLYQIHCWDPGTPLEETMRALDDLVRQGKVLYLGVSNFAAWQIMKALCVSEVNGLARFDCLQPQYSLIEREIERETIPLCLSEGLGIIPWSPLGGGFLTGKYTREAQPAGARLTENRSAPWENVWDKRATERNWATLDVVREVASAHDVTPAQVAIAWVLAQPGVTSPIIGARNLEQLSDNLDALDVELTAEEMARLDEVSALTPVYPYRFINFNSQPRAR
ncbi:MAG: aldo/keto reductase [Anaerolineae bacterium]|nr:aldo/keto reductase [Anaerolineae bacterium]